MQLGNLTWDDTGNRYYYTGIDGVALFVWDQSLSSGSGWYGTPIAWNGVTAINENPSGAESNKIYADNVEYLNLLSKEEFGLTLECYQTPSAFAVCDGVKFDTLSGKVKVRGQERKPFGLVYRVQKGNDTTEAGELGYIYHIVYGCKAAPSSQDHSTVNDSPEAQTFSYEITTTPITDSTKFDSLYLNAKQIAHIEIEATTSVRIGQLNTLCYGRSSMPSPNDIYYAFH